MLKAGDKVNLTPEGRVIFPQLIGKTLEVLRVSPEGNAVVFCRFPHFTWAADYFEKFDGFLLDQVYDD